MAKNGCAWNDPPPLSYSDTCTSSSVRRTPLNKRVGFPLHQSHASPVLTDPPAGLCSSPFSPVSSHSHQDTSDSGNASESDALPANPCPSEDVSSDTAVPEAEMLSFILDSLESVIMKIPLETEKLSVSGQPSPETPIRQLALCLISSAEQSLDQHKKQDDIKSRIDMLKEAWNASLSSAVKLKMFKLAKYLSAGKHDEADEMHRVLIVDHVAEVRQWMVAVKHIIQFSRMLPPVQ